MLWSLHRFKVSRFNTRGDVLHLISPPTREFLPSRERGISLTQETQWHINALHLAETQIAFFHWLPVRHTSFSEAVRRAVCLERRTVLRKFRGLPTRAWVHVFVYSSDGRYRHFGSISSRAPNLLQWLAQRFHQCKAESPQ